MKLLVFIAFLATSFMVGAQEAQTFKIQKSASVNLSEIKEDWKTNVQHLEAPKPGGDSYASFLAEKKEELKLKYPIKPNSSRNNDYLGTGNNPVTQRIFEGNEYGGGLPNDNTIAISNDGTIVSSINSNIYVYDSVGTELMIVSLDAFGDTLGLTAKKYDPKLRYDHENDRFILVYLSGTTDATNNIVVAFSQTNDPTQEWNLYALPGNPLDNGTWSDYPALGLTKDDFFITVNLIQTGVSWQEGFRGSIVWQIDKSTGFEGNEELTTKLWSDIRYDGAFIRNMHPVTGGDDFKEQVYFLSNRNFDESNDTIFVVNISGETNDVSAELTMEAVKSNVPYGMPPNGRQEYDFQVGSLTLTTVDELSTNDARVLGAYLENNEINFVQNSINHATGQAAILHGIISNVSEGNYSIDGRILGDSTDWGYPNIAYAGLTEGDKKSMITINFTKPFMFPGAGFIYYDGDEDAYSDKIVTAEGSNLITMMNGADRWGDYSGIQRVYNQPGKVIMTGTYGGKVDGNRNGTRTKIITAYPAETPFFVSAENHKKDVTYTVSPNPSSDLIHIRFSSEKTSNTRISVYDLDGKLIKVLYTDVVKAGENQLTFSLLPLHSGVYFVNFESDQGVYHSEKIIKN